MTHITNEQIEATIALARAAASRAYAPYSNFAVGAGLLTTDGRVFSGCNVENASYGLTICAERNVMFHAVAEGPLDIALIAIYTPTPLPTAPCGACRQVIREFGPNARIVCVCDGSDVVNTTLAELLPASFGPDSL